MGVGKMYVGVGEYANSYGFQNSLHSSLNVPENTCSSAFQGSEESDVTIHGSSFTLHYLENLYSWVFYTCLVKSEDLFGFICLYGNQIVFIPPLPNHIAL